MKPQLSRIPFREYRNLPQASAVYFVVADATIVYVGQSDNLRNRWSAHHLRKQFAELAASGSEMVIV